MTTKRRGKNRQDDAHAPLETQVAGPSDRETHKLALRAFWPFFKTFGGFLVTWGILGLFGALVMYLAASRDESPESRAYYLDRFEQSSITSIVLIALGVARILWLRHNSARTRRRSLSRRQ